MKGQNSQSKQVTKIPRRSSQETIKKKSIGTHTSRSSSRGTMSPTNSSCSASADKPRVPRRKASNPFLRGGLVGQTGSNENPLATNDELESSNQSETGNGNWRPRSPVLTRSLSKHRMQAGAHPPRLPHREASIQDGLFNARWDSLGMPNRTSQNQQSQQLQQQPATAFLAHSNRSKDKMSFMDLEWAKLSMNDGDDDSALLDENKNRGQRRHSFEPYLVTPRKERAPRAPRRKASSADLDDLDD